MALYSISKAHLLQWESKVYLAVAPDGSLRIVKIYLIVSAEFKKRMQYIAGDPDFLT